MSAQPDTLLYSSFASMGLQSAGGTPPSPGASFAATYLSPTKRPAPQRQEATLICSSPKRPVSIRKPATMQKENLLSPQAKRKSPRSLYDYNFRPVPSPTSSSSSPSMAAAAAAAAEEDRLCDESLVQGVVKMLNVDEDKDKLFSPIYPNNTSHHLHHHPTTIRDPKQRAITEFTVPSPPKAASPTHGVSRYEYTFDACSEDDFNPLVFMKMVPPLPFEYRHRLPVLPKKTRSSPRLSVVLDLDETLVHCSTEPMPKSELTFNITAQGVHYTVYARRRPHMDYFLREVAKIAEVTVFTASQQVYAERLLDLLDPKRELIKHRLYRQACVPVEGVFLKDLSVLGRDLASTVIVDNSPQAFAYQVDNGIPIETWMDEDDDTELVKLLKFIREDLVSAQDVRHVLRRYFGIQSQIDATRVPEEMMDIM